MTQVPLDLTRQAEPKKQQPPAPVEQQPKPNPVEPPTAPPAVAVQPVAAPPKPTGYAAIAATNTASAAAPGIPTNSAPEPPTDSFTNISEWNQVTFRTFIPWTFWLASSC